MESRNLLFTLLCAACFPLTATAATYNEISDAGAFASTAQEIPAGADRIVGTLRSGTGLFPGVFVDVDVFVFAIAETVNAVFDGISNEFDVNLLLLKEGFFGLYGDDNGGGSSNSRITITLNPGVYFIAIGPKDTHAYNFTSGSTYERIWGNDSGQLDPLTASAPILSIQSPNRVGTNNESYEIRFNFLTGRIDKGALDLSAGKNPSRMIGKGIHGSKTGKGQIVTVSGRNRAFFLLDLHNSIETRYSSLSLRGSTKGIHLKIIESRARVNVAATVKSGTHYRQLERLGLFNHSWIRYSVTLRSSKPISKRLILFRAKDRFDRTIIDTAGALVTLPGQ